MSHEKYINSPRYNEYEKGLLWRLYKMNVRSILKKKRGERRMEEVKLAFLKKEGGNRRCLTLTPQDD